MKYIISALSCLAVVAADKLNNVYLPPTSSSSAGGNGNILRAPYQPSRQFSSGTYQTSQQGNIYGNLQQISQRENIHRNQQQISQQGNIFTNQQQLSQQRSVYSNQKQSSINSYSSSPAQPQVAILRFNNDNNEDGSYRFDYKTANKITQQESGQLKNAGTDQESSVVQGTYSYVGTDGLTYTINYVADEQGFRAIGDHLPVAPAIPAEIQKALEQNAADEASGIFDDGQYRPDPSERITSAQVNRQYLAPKVQGGYQQQQQQGYKY